MSNYNTKIYESNERREISDTINFFGDVLDLGCASGSFLKNLIQKFKIKSAIGLDLYLNKYRLHKDPKISYIKSDILDLKIKKKFDFITLLDCLEHTNDHLLVLEFLKKKLKPNGKIVISVPNFLFFPNIIKIILNKDFKYTDYGTLDYTHLRFFTLKSLKRSLVETGYKNINVRFINKFNLKSRFFYLAIFYPIFRILFGKGYQYLQIMITAEN